MDRPKICLTLTGATLAEDLKTLDKYRDYVDIAELRADFLNDDDRLVVKRFPQMAGIPCILTLRRVIDGGMFKEGEAGRTILFARALSFAEANKDKNFEYVDFEEDFRVPSLQDAALAFGTKVIRSIHDMKNPVPNLIQRVKDLCTTGFEIPKIAFMPHSLDDVRILFEEAAKLESGGHILIAMGPLGVPTRILSAKLGNYLTYCSPVETVENVPKLSQLDPIQLNDVYHFKSIRRDTALYGITGWPLTATSSPMLHNSGFKGHNINAVYVPVRSESFEQAFAFADAVGFKGMSVTVPHKERVPAVVAHCDEKVRAIGASNTIVKKDGVWAAYNTDASGFARAILGFTGFKDLSGKRVAIIGAGGAARAVAYAVKMLKGKACVFNRTVVRAKELAALYDFEYAGLMWEPREAPYKLLKKYSDIIIQTTSKGMNCTPPSTEENDPLFFYKFVGTEILMDIVYVPEVTPIMARAAEAGCAVCNGYDMLRYQGYEQFELFTGEVY